MEQAGIRVEELRLYPRAAAPGLVLAASLYVPAGAEREAVPLPGLIVAHGAGSNHRRHAEFSLTACAAGMAVLAIDFRGHGESGGELDGPAEQDILAAAALLRNHPLVDPGRIGYRGSSMGGYYGLRSGREARFAALALLCPATEQVLLDAIGDKTGKQESDSDGLKLRYDADSLRSYYLSRDVYADAAELDAPVLLVHARGDDVVPLSCSLEIARRLRGPVDLMVLPAGDHSSASGDPAVHRRVVTWLLERLGS